MKLESQLLILTALWGATIAISFAGEPPAITETEQTPTKQAATAAKSKPKETIPGADIQPAAYFYTGKPYDEDLGGYVFNYRTYSPAMSRWTTSDPSGFPDGTNNLIYAPVPTSSLDCLGLWRIKVSGDAASYKTSKSTDEKIGGSANISWEGAGEGSGSNFGKFTSVTITGWGSGWYSNFGYTSTSTQSDPLSITFTVDSNGKLDYSENDGMQTNSNGSLQIGVALNVRFNSDTTIGHIRTNTGVAKDASGITGIGVTVANNCGQITWASYARRHSLNTTEIKVEVVE